MATETGDTAPDFIAQLAKGFASRQFEAPGLPAERAAAYRTRQKRTPAGFN